MQGPPVVMEAPVQQTPSYVPRQHELLPLRHAIEEAVDEARRDGVPLPLDAPSRDLLECDADDLALANHRAATVACIDRSVDSNRQGRAVRVGVINNLHPRHDALGNRYFVATDRKPDDLDL